MNEFEPLKPSFNIMFVIGHSLESIYRDERNRFCMETRLYYTENVKYIHRFSFSDTPAFLKEKLPEHAINEANKGNLVILKPHKTIPLPMMSGKATPLSIDGKTYYEIKDPTVSPDTELM